LLDTTVSSRIPHKTLYSASSLIPQSVHSANSSVLQVRPFRKNSVTCSFRKSSVSSRSAMRLTREFARIARFLGKPTYKCCTWGWYSFRKAFILQISPLRKKSVTCSASFLVSRICSDSSFLTLARRRRSNCRFLEEIRVKRAPLGVVARSFVSLTFFSSTWFNYARHRET